MKVSSKSSRCLPIAVALVAMSALWSCDAGGLEPPAGRAGLGFRVKTQSPLPARYPKCPCIYVANMFGGGGSGIVTIYPTSATGNYSPGKDFIAGSSTLLDDPAGIAVDPTGKVYVANLGGGASVTTYAPKSSGNVVPRQVIQGSSTGLSVPSGIAIASNGDIYVANGVSTPAGSITVFGASANGNVAPLRTISGSMTGLSGPCGIALDGTGKLFVANSYGDSITVYNANANGNVAPVQTISGSNTGLIYGAYGLSWRSRRIYVTVGNYQVSIFPDSASGNVAPKKSISGPATELNFPIGIGLGSRGQIFVGNTAGSYSVTSYEGFASLAPGNNNVAPATVITGANTLLDLPWGVAIH